MAAPSLGAKDPAPTQYMGPPHDPNPFDGPAWNDILLLLPSTESPHDISQQPLHDRGIGWIRPWYFHHSVSIALALLLLGLVAVPEDLSIQHMALEGYDAPNKVRVLPACYTTCCSWPLGAAPIGLQASEAATPSALLRQNPHHDKVHASWRQTRRLLRATGPDLLNLWEVTHRYTWEHIDHTRKNRCQQIFEELSTFNQKKVVRFVASHFGSWLHLGAGLPRLAISPPHSWTSRMVGKPVMVSFLLSSKTSSVQEELNTREKQRLHSRDKLWVYGRSKQIQSNMRATSAA